MGLHARTAPTMTIKVYAMPLQHNYAAIHDTCKASGESEEFVMTNLMTGDNKTPDYLAKFPMHCAPAMEDTDNGLCITETNAILRYIARKNGSKLYPTDLRQAAICDMVLDHKLCSLGKDVAYTYIYPMAGFASPCTPEQEAAALKKIQTDQWPAVQKFITESKGPFVCGSQVSIADLSLWGHFKVLNLCNPDCVVFKEVDGLKAWFDAVEGTIGADWFNDDNWGFWKSKKAA